MQQQVSCSGTHADARRSNPPRTGRRSGNANPTGGSMIQKIAGFSKPHRNGPPVAPYLTGQSIEIIPDHFVQSVSVTRQPAGANVTFEALTSTPLEKPGVY